MKTNVIPTLKVKKYDILMSANCIGYIEDIARWREDMNFMFEWQE